MTALPRMPALCTDGLTGIGVTRICAKPPPNQSKDDTMSELSVAEAIESIYASLRADNADIDALIATLKAALIREGMKEAVFDPTKLAQSNRSGRKVMQAYFRQRGVTVKFSDQ
jgi:hypothetical protein